MPPALNLNPRTRHLVRRVVALALFALQGAMALSPIAESVHTNRAHMHIEAPGTRHPYEHDESTCALCFVQSLHAAVPQRPGRLAPTPIWPGSIAFVARVAPAPDVAPTNLSRAPPLSD